MDRDHLSSHPPHSETYVANDTTDDIAERADQAELELIASIEQHLRVHIMDLLPLPLRAYHESEEECTYELELSQAELIRLLEQYVVLVSLFSLLLLGTHQSVLLLHLHLDTYTLGPTFRNPI